MDSLADTVLSALAWLAGGAGLFFFWVSGIGLVRMPDFFTRMHAGTKASTLGLLLILFAAVLTEPQWTPKLLILGVFTLLTNPLGASVLARAAHRSGTDTVPMVHDALAGRLARASAAGGDDRDDRASGYDPVPGETAPNAPGARP